MLDQQDEYRNCCCNNLNTTINNQKQNIDCDEFNQIRKEMLENIKCLNFAITELGLYLDTHPNDK